MAASDARWPPKKNTAWRVYFPLVDADGDLVADGAGDTPDCERSIDGGNFADCTAEMVEVEVNSGIYYLDLNASEMNGDCISIICKTATAGTKTTPIVVYPVSGGFNELEDFVSDIYSDLQIVETAIDSDQTAIEKAISDIKSHLTIVETALDSDQLQTENAISDVKSELVIISDGVSDLQAAMDSDQTSIEAKIGSDNLLTQSDLSDIISHLAVLDAAIDSDYLLTATAISDVKSELVVISDAVSDVESSLVIVKSDTLAIEAAGGALTSAQLAMLTTIASDVVHVHSDTTAIEAGGGSLTSAQDATLTTIASDVVHVHSDTAVIEAAVSDVESSLVIAKSDLVVVEAAVSAARGEPGQGNPPASSDIATKVDYLYKFMRNKVTQTATETKVFNDAGAVADHKSTVSDDGTTFNRGEFITGA